MTEKRLSPKEFDAIRRWSWQSSRGHLPPSSDSVWEVDTRANDQLDAAGKIDELVLERRRRLLVAFERRMRTS